MKHKKKNGYAAYGALINHVTETGELAALEVSGTVDPFCFVAILAESGNSAVRAELKKRLPRLTVEDSALVLAEVASVMLERAKAYRDGFHFAADKVAAAE